MKELFFIVAMWIQPGPFFENIYVFTNPNFETAEECIDFVQNNHMMLNQYLIQEYDHPFFVQSPMYCIDKKSKKEIEEDAKQKIRTEET